MVSSDFSIKTLGEYFGNSVLNNNKWDKINDNFTKRNHTWNRAQLSLRRKK